MSPMYFRLGSGAVKFLWNRSGTNGDDGSAAVVRTRLRRRIPNDRVLAHDAGDPLVVDQHSGVAQFSGHPRRSVGTTGIRVDLTDPLGQELVVPLPGRPRLPAGQPLVVAGAVHAHNLAEPLH